MNNFEFNINLSEKIRKDILSELEKRAPILAHMYEGAIHTLNHAIIPNRVNLAAHSLRELIEKLTWHLNISTKKRESLTSHVANLRSGWEELMSGEIIENKQKIIEFLFSKDTIGRTKKFVKKICVFFERVPGKTKTIQRAFKNLCPENASAALVQDFQSSIWKEYSAYFNGVGHHNAFVEEEFREKLLTFEQYLITLLKPKVFDLMREIESIIEEGEKDAYY